MADAAILHRSFLSLMENRPNGTALVDSDFRLRSRTERSCICRPKVILSPSARADCHILYARQLRKASFPGFLDKVLRWCGADVDPAPLGCVLKVGPSYLIPGD